MKYFWRISILCVLVIAITSLVLFVSYWNKAGTIIDQSGIEQRVPRYTDEPFSIAEKTIMRVTFPSVKDKPQSSICPTFSSLIPDKTRMPAMGISGNLALQWQSVGEPNSKIMTASFERLFVACRLEKTYEQKIILKDYLSTAYFGKGEFGIDVAAQSIFDMPLAELGEQEGLALAALVQSPNLRNNPAQWATRQEKLKARLGG